MFAAPATARFLAPAPAADDDDAVAVFDFGCWTDGGGAIRSTRSRVSMSGDTSHRGTPSISRAHSNECNADQLAGAERKAAIRAGSVAADHSDSEDDDEDDDEADDDDEINVDTDEEAAAEVDPATVCFGFLLAISISASACSRVCTQCCSHRSATRD